MTPYSRTTSPQKSQTHKIIIPAKRVEKLLWMTDLHLDQMDQKGFESFLADLKKGGHDAIVITGDISDAGHIRRHLGSLAKACAPKPVYFVLGNHDFYGGSFDQVELDVAAVCQEHKNLHHLGQGEIIELSDSTALVGHRGWADGRAGWGAKTCIETPDRYGIKDFRGLSTTGLFTKLAALGRESAGYFRSVLPYAMRCYRHVLLATHVPVHHTALRYNDRLCGWTHQPHYLNFSAGGTLMGIARKNLGRMVTVLCGHTHSPAHVRIAPNLEVRVGVPVKHQKNNQYTYIGIN